MTFDQIQYFIAIAECNTYFDAAEELNISQSALSKQIIKLEKELENISINKASYLRFNTSSSPLWLKCVQLKDNVYGPGAIGNTCLNSATAISPFLNLPG